uniref:glycosyltransferase family 2 protein n=1 Tax=Eubacterium cellulosolvens TaxID=29322 RepID=UPI000688DD3A|nr:glycosyltransferase family 2 protein [[Eubacterium] cellulosolvens]
MANTSISVAMAVFNGERYLKEQLDSIRHQSRKPSEVVVVDDASKDGTTELLEDYGKCYPEFPLKVYVNRENLGYRLNFLSALKNCTGEIQFLCDQDDIWENNKIEAMTNVLQKHPEISVLASSFSLIDEEGEKLELPVRKGWSNHNFYHREVEHNDLHQVQAEELIWHNFCQGCSECFRSEIREAFIQTFTGEIPHDWFLNLLGASEGGVWFLNRELFRYRLHADNSLGMKVKADTAQKMRGAYRTLEARQSLNVIAEYRRLAPEKAEASDALREAECFLKANITNIEEGKTFSLIRQAGRKEYRQLKSWKAILADICFSLRNRK